MASIAAGPAPRAAIRIAAPPGVFRPRSDALLLAAVLRERRLARGARVLDLFTGSGVIAVAAAREGASAVTAVDLSRRAVLAARLNGRRNGVRVRALRGDLFAPVAGERFDLITANPPYLPGAETLPGGGPSRAWEGGADGRLLVDRLCAAAAAHLASDGRLLIVQSSLTGERETLDRLADAGLRARVLVRRRGPLGPLARARLAELRASGRLAPGAEEEELLVIEAGRDAEQTGTDVRERPAPPVRVTPYRDGPYLLRGPFELTDQEGREIAGGRQTVALCRCGRSQIRPFCDGTHKLIGFRADSGAEGPPSA